METGLLHLHNILRWIILILLVVSIYTAYTATNNNNKKWWLFTLIAAHTTLLIGLYQVYNYFARVTLDGTIKMGDIMKTKNLRFYIVEHPILMILSVLLITLAYRNTKSAKYKKAFQLFLLALIVILVAVPWPFREGVARPWFPGM
jgi:protein-S-isoprenylcysteine O-methyltransferase Ste14